MYNACKIIYIQYLSYIYFCRENNREYPKQTVISGDVGKKEQSNGITID